MGQLQSQYCKACEENNPSLVRELLSKGADVNWSRRKDGWSGLHIAACGNYGELLELLLAQTGVDVNIRTNEDRTPLMLACMEGHDNLVRRLCQADWSTAEIRDQLKNTMIYYGWDNYIADTSAHNRF